MNSYLDRGPEENRVGNLSEGARAGIVGNFRGGGVKVVVVPAHKIVGALHVPDHLRTRRAGRWDRDDRRTCRGECAVGSWAAVPRPNYCLQRRIRKHWSRHGHASKEVSA